MAADAASTERLDYLQRSGAVPDVAAAAVTSGAAPSRRLLRVCGIGRPDKGDPRRSARSQQRPAPRWRPPTAELITGLYGYRIPLAFGLTGSPDGVRVQLGTWSAREVPAAVQDRRIKVMESVLRGLYPVVDLERSASSPQRWQLGGIALGVPAPAGVDESDGAGPLDRVVRSLAGTSWSVLVLAYPASESAVGKVRSSILNEMRAVASAAAEERAPSPLTEQYVELLKASLKAAGEGMATGAWRVGVYLLGDGDSYPSLASVWRSVMSGEDSLPEPVRVFDNPSAEGLAAQWALPDRWGEQGPGFYRRPFECQTLLSTAELASIMHLPELETPGFRVDLAPRFDVVAAPAAGGGPSLALGQVLHNRRPTATTYAVPLRALTRHVLVAGTTGSGKTNTIFSLLARADAAGVPFLVLEPAKTEYRALIGHPNLGARVRVFTAGKANVSPLQLNPFEVPSGTTVSEHLDLIRAAFGAAFGMWTPLPQILERCIHAIYADRGWDLRTNANVRLAPGEDTNDAYPTLSDLLAKVGEIIPTLGYDDRVTGDMHASLTTRLESLRTGGKGAMLDVARSLPMDELLAHPTVIELEGMGDEGDKAFLAGLILIRLAEHRRAQGQRDGLAHLLVIEEAHRLLANVATQVSEEVANPRGQAVETFSNLLSEIRAYGQGVIIADQIPVRLAPDVVKNTTLKIAHRTVSADDRAALGESMAMEKSQTAALTTLAIGEAAIFSAGDDSPLLVQVPLAKDPLAPTPPGDTAVAAHMARWRSQFPDATMFLPRPFCAQTCVGAPAACDAARRLMDDEFVQRTLSRTVLSAVGEPGALNRLWEDFVGVVRARRPVFVPEAELLRSLAGHGSDWLAARRGAQEVWTYTATARFRDALRAALQAQVEGAPDAAARLAAFQATAQQLQARRAEPYPACHLVCTQDPPLCLYRSAVSDLVASGRYRASWRDADVHDASSADKRRRETWEACQDAAYELVEFPDPDTPSDQNAAVELAARRVCLCFEQQMLAADGTKVPRTARRILARVVTEAGL